MRDETARYQAIHSRFSVNRFWNLIWLIVILILQSEIRNLKSEIHEHLAAEFVKHRGAHAVADGFQ